MTTRRRIRVDFDLPELTPAQADFLWTFLESLASDLWDGYERELLDVENERSRPPEVNDWIAEHYDCQWTADDHEDVPVPCDADLESCPVRSLHGDERCPTCGHEPGSAAPQIVSVDPKPEF